MHIFKKMEKTLWLSATSQMRHGTWLARGPGGLARPEIVAMVSILCHPHKINYHENCSRYFWFRVGEFQQYINDVGLQKKLWFIWQIALLVRIYCVLPWKQWSGWLLISNRYEHKYHLVPLILIHLKLFKAINSNGQRDSNSAWVVWWYHHWLVRWIIFLNNS